MWPPLTVSIYEIILSFSSNASPLFYFFFYLEVFFTVKSFFPHSVARIFSTCLLMYSVTPNLVYPYNSFCDISLCSSHNLDSVSVVPLSFFQTIVSTIYSNIFEHSWCFLMVCTALHFIHQWSPLYIIFLFHLFGVPVLLKVVLLNWPHLSALPPV